MALQRILEPELMDSEQDAREYDEMNNSAANTLFVDDLLSSFANDTKAVG